MKPNRLVTFIGGVADGLISQDPGEPFWNVARSERCIRGKYHPVTPDYQIFKETTYRRERLRTDDTEFVFYVADGVRNSEAIAKLLAGYSVHG